MRKRVSVLKEDRIWQLRTQGYCYDSIGRITNTNPNYMTVVLRRVRRRPPEEEDPIRRGRYCNFLSDDQILDIRRRRNAGETYLTIAQRYDVSESAICHIITGKTYREPEYEGGYKYDFSNRLTR